jgi:dethiobiotin synthetase
MPTPGLFVVGTDTDVGKTQVAAAIVRSLRAAGRRVGVYKPVASGCGAATTQGSDPRMLWDAAGRPLEPADVCPQTFAAAIAPVAAARAEGRRVDEGLLRTGLDRWRTVSDLVIIEGAGGLFSPVGESTLVVDLAREFSFPLVIVDAARLGAVGRTLVTVRSARAEGLRVAAVVLSHTVPPSPETGPTSTTAIVREAAADLTRHLATIPVVILGHGDSRMPAGIDWEQVATG